MKRLSVIWAFVALLALPAAASAATTVEESAGTVFVEGDAGANAITVFFQDEYVVIVEAGKAVQDIDDNDECEQDGDRVRCTTLGSLELVRVRGGEGDDTLSSDALIVIVLLQGQGGNDTLRGAPSDPYSEMSGGDGNDTLDARKGSLSEDDSGGAGDDVFKGSDQDPDYFKQEPGGDTYIGGARPPCTTIEPCIGCKWTGECEGDRDVLHYTAGPVAVTLDGIANDGAGEGDNVHADVDAIGGTGGADVLDATGARGSVTLLGSSGDDVLTGGPGDDALSGELGADTVSGGPGNDILDAGDHDSDPPTPDRLNGGEGDDVLEPGGPADDLVGGPGWDAAKFVQHSGLGQEGYGMEITLDDQANDGWRGGDENDNVHSDMESIQTFQGNDRIVGSSGAEHFDTGYGNDDIEGRGGVDHIEAGPGADNIHSRDGGFDLVNCGAGADATVQGDEGDRLENCEASALTPLPSPPDTTRPELVLGGATRISARAFARARGVTVTARTNETSSLLGEAVVRGMIARAGDLVIGERSLPLANAGTRRFKIRFSRRDVRAINKRLRRRSFAMTLRVTATDAAGNRTAATRRVTIRRR